MSKVAVVLGVGPGLGMSMAHRFATEGFTVALVSRSSTRHAGYVAALAEHGVEAAAFTADVTDPDQLRSTLADISDRLGGIDLAYYGPGATDLDFAPTDVRETTAADVRREFEKIVLPAVQMVNEVLPGMLARGAGGLLFAGGLSGQLPMPMLGALGPATAALRQYVLALHESLAPLGVFAATLTIGGLVERGDIHAMVLDNADRFGPAAGYTLDPDDIAAQAWDLYTERDRAEATFNAMATQGS